MYRDRVQERVGTLLGELDLKIDRTDLIKEVAIFAERSDVAEEITRLACHLDQFLEIMKEPEGTGHVNWNFLRRKCFARAIRLAPRPTDVEISRGKSSRSKEP